MDTKRCHGECKRALTLDHFSPKGNRCRTCSANAARLAREARIAKAHAASKRFCEILTYPEAFDNGWAL